jgi:uncharacterized protein YbcI
VNALVHSTASAFFVVLAASSFHPPAEKGPMERIEPTVAHQIAEAASAFEQRRTGRAPESVAVVLSEGTVVVTLYGALSPAEQALARSQEGAAQLQEFHRQLFQDSAGELRAAIARVTGVQVREAAAEMVPATGAVVQVFATGAVVQVFLLASRVPESSWSGSGLGQDHELPGGETP